MYNVIPLQVSCPVLLSNTGCGLEDEDYILPDGTTITIGNADCRQAFGAFQNAKRLELRMFCQNNIFASI